MRIDISILYKQHVAGPVFRMVISLDDVVVYPRQSRQRYQHEHHITIVSVLFANKPSIIIYHELLFKDVSHE